MSRKEARDVAFKIDDRVMQIKNNYDISAAVGINNVIACVINDKYQAFIELSFGELSTQGTNYSFKIEPITTDKKPHNYLPNTEGSTQSFKAILTTSDGIELDANKYELKWEWEQSSQYYKIGTYEYDYDEEKKITEAEALRSLLTPYIAFDDEEKNNNQCIIILQKSFGIKNQKATIENKTYYDEAEKYIKTLQVTDSGSSPNIHILKATCKVNALYKNGDNSDTRTVTLKALYPIGVLNKSDELFPEQLNLQGPFILQGSSDNVLITKLETPYSIGELNQKTDATWSLLNQESSNTNTNFPYSINEQGQLQSTTKTFTSTSYPSTIMATWDNNFYQQPLMLQMVKYDVGLTNEWAGGVVTIDDTESTIMATAIGAGHKDTSTNLFTGVLMGEFSQGTKVLNGLYGLIRGQILLELMLKPVMPFLGVELKH